MLPWTAEATLHDQIDEGRRNDFDSLCRPPGDLNGGAVESHASAPLGASFGISIVSLDMLSMRRTTSSCRYTDKSFRCR